MRSLSLWKLVFAVLVALPFLPATSIYAAAALAKIKGCNIGEEELCVAGAISVSRTIVAAVQASSGPIFISVALLWLALCYLSAGLAWSRIASRLLVGGAVTFIFAGLPYFASLPSLGNFVEPQCKTYGGGFGVCGLFDGSIGGGPHILSIQIWISVIGLPFGLLAFMIYALVILRKRTLISA